METEKIQEIKDWGIAKVSELLQGRATIVYKKFHKTHWGRTKTVKGSDPVQYEIEIDHGENFEGVSDDYVYKEDFTKDTILHEIAHALVGVKICTHHSHDKLWKEQAKNLGAYPVSGATLFSFKLWKEGLKDYSILGKPREVRMNVFNGENFTHVGVESQSGPRNHALTTISGDVVLRCPKCHSVWIRKKATDDHTFYCEICEIPVDNISDMWEEIFESEGKPAYCKIMEEEPEQVMSDGDDQ